VGALGRTRLLAALPVWFVVTVALGFGLFVPYAAFAAFADALVGWRPGPFPFGTEDGVAGTATLGAVALGGVYVTAVVRRRYERLRLPNVAALSPGAQAGVFLGGGVVGLLVGAVVSAPLAVLFGADAAVVGIATGWSGTYLVIDAVAGSVVDDEQE